MNALTSLARGFFVSIEAIWIYSAIALARGGDPMLGLTYCIILIIPFITATYLWLRKKPPKNINSVEKWCGILYSFQGAALACWAFDLTTTGYSINIAKVAVEINPLGWPLGALGALTYYAPTIILSYILLFKINQKISHYAAIPITIVALCMGAMNLNAGVGNFGFFIGTTNFPSRIGSILPSIVGGMALVDVAFFARIIGNRVQFNLRSLKTS